MKFTIGINAGDRVRYIHRKGWTGKVVTATNHACLVEWDENPDIPNGFMWISTRHLRRIGIIRSLIMSYRRKVISAIEQVNQILP